MKATRTDGAAGLTLVTTVGLGQVLLYLKVGMLAWLSLGLTVWALTHAYRLYGEGAWARERAALLERQLEERMALLERSGRVRSRSPAVPPSL